MTQLALSNDLITLTAEINSYKQVAGQAVFEIGRRLKHVKENDLAHGQFGEWVESLGINSQHAHRYIQAYEQFSPTSANLGFSKILELLSLPDSIDRQDFITQPHAIPSTGETKTVDEMTVRELREVKKALQEAESQAKREAQEKHHWQKIAEQSRNRPPVIQTQTIEPTDYQDLKQQSIAAQQISKENVELKRNMQDMRSDYESKLSNQQNDLHAVRKLRESFKNILSQVNTEHYNAIFFYEQIEGTQAAHEATDTFLREFSNLINTVFAEWKEKIEIKAS